MTKVIKVTIQLGPEDGPWFADLLRSVGDAEITVLGPEHSEPQTSPLQADTLVLLQQMASPATRQNIEQFISDEVSTRHASDVPVGGKANYVRLHVPGPRRRGAYAYVSPGTANVNFRLPKEYASGCQHAFPRNVRDDNPHAVSVRLTSVEAVAEARELAGEAYERALED
jgi:hypothetical protein